MSTGKRLAKRSIVGTRVCAPGGDGKYYSAVIHAVKNPTGEDTMDKKNTINLTPTTRYAVRFDSRQGNVGRTTAEFSENDLIGPGFQSVLGVELVPGQKCFVTYNGREVRGEVCKHHAETDEVIITIHPAGAEAAFEVQKKLEDVRLLESRKSARLADQDTDFARLADMAGDRKRGSMDVPVNTGSRKRRPSSSYDDDPMDECSAALVLMSLSGSPQSPFFFYEVPHSRKSPGSTSSSTSFRSTPSPPPRTCSPNSVPLSSSSVSDEGIITDYYPVKQPRKKKGVTRAAFQCTWRTCVKIANTAESIQAHIRHEHLKNKVCEYAEEDFYYKEIDFPYTSPSPTLSHRDMARPFHEDPDYQRQLVGSMRQSLLISPNQPIPQSSPKIIKLSRRSNSPKTSPRRVRGDNRKCRKVYGMNSRDSWCTQCKWKKACTRFAEWSVVLKCHKNTTN